MLDYQALTFIPNCLDVGSRIMTDSDGSKTGVLEVR